ncbi:MAG: DUF1080 domain-containing protein, partial [Planctomycetota bacterium]|nr:DUF1080 domain-containing protein [Planctomycetota bacterium]
NWKFVGDGSFEVRRGIARQNGGSGVWYFADKAFGDFVLKVEFQQLRAENNSGVMFRMQEPDGDIGRVHRYGYEIQIGSSGTDQRSTGSVYGFSPPFRSAAKASRWNEVELICIANEAFVSLDGKMINHFEGIKYASGFIGLQNYSNVQVYFKDLRVMELTGDLTNQLTRLRREADKARDK